jgi:hypothetical protein
MAIPVNDDRDTDCAPRGSTLEAIRSHLLQKMEDGRPQSGSALNSLFRSIDANKTSFDIRARAIRKR